MKIYTRTGDDGTTGLIGGNRVRKCDARIECYGTIDELNASLGLVVTEAAQHPAQSVLVVPIREIQNDLFVIGSHLALPDVQASHAKTDSWLPALDEQMVTRLEMQIDAAQDRLEPLRHFILPGGSEAAARLHLARTICRRAERLLVDFAHDRPVPVVLLTYLNRLSDWLFVYARLANHLVGVEDIPWDKDRS